MCTSERQYPIFIRRLSAELPQLFSIETGVTMLIPPQTPQMPQTPQTPQAKRLSEQTRARCRQMFTSAALYLAAGLSVLACDVAIAEPLAPGAPIVIGLMS